MASVPADIRLRQPVLGAEKALDQRFPKFHERMHLRPTGSSEGTDDDRFYFGIDMGPYWFEPLGRCFGVAQGEIERRARNVIRVDWELKDNDRWHDDQRARRGAFKGRETYHSHGSYPRTDDLHFYLSYHAMMVVAGRLLATCPLHEDPEDSWGDFHSWFSRHDLSRADNGWLADRRDPTPLEWPDWKNETSAEGWRWSLVRDDFYRVLFGSDGIVTVWGDWTAISGERRENAHIRSALVSTEHSRALVRALQTVTNPHDYRIPGAGDDSEIEQGGFLLKGWVVQPMNELGIDKHDPWAGDISFPPIQPAEFVVDSMGLASDPEHRVWHSAIEGHTEPVLWSRLWGHFQDQEDEDEQESGQRFEASTSFIRELLNTTENDLLVEVEMNRQRRFSRYSHQEDEGLGYITPYAKLFLIRGDGSVYTI
ncbi:hypothetical protein HC341_08535 [Aquisalimonas sp. 2447]|uniref:hypothetical protein n=1 Tax=Aquisalimonas sp. 2447 TaxID=2740807 RepID=UPI0014323FCD|nr:hypothetical protein [Aquisalimonas sp. 2447]QIT55247.1 hypothetical protein HC341_08535 [Aquisalimonas sp. 2447]